MNVRAHPGSSREWVEVRDEVIHVFVTAQPVDGQANTAIIKVLAKKLKCAKSSVEIVKGDTGKDKRVAIDGMSPKEALDILRAIEP